MANDGKHSEAIFEKYIESRGGFLYRLTDLFDASKKQLVTGRKASDFIVTVDGRNEYAEVKSIEDKNSFKFSSIRTEQWRVATRVVKAGGDYFFYLHFLAFDKWCKVPASVILRHDKKSIQLKEVEQYQFSVN